MSVDDFTREVMGWLTQVGAVEIPSFRRGHECNGWCRGARHAEVIYVDSENPDDPEEIRAGFLGFCAANDIAYVAHEPAPEAPPINGVVASYDARRDSFGIEAASPADVPYLLIWE